MTDHVVTSEPVTRALGGEDAATSESSGGTGGSVRSSEETILEMRQVAGLTAGTVMPLHPGLFQFRESERDIGFSLSVKDAGSVVVLPGSVEAHIDKSPVVEPAPLGQAVLNVGSACFTVRPPRPPSTPNTILAGIESSRRPTPPVAVPDFSAEEALDDDRGSFLSSLFSRRDGEDDTTLSAEGWSLIRKIEEARHATAERHRRLHPDPEELRSRLERMEPGLWERSVEHPLFGRFGVAYCTIPWEPRFDEPERIPEHLYDAIDALSDLAWVPVTANLLYGPLGIVGGRSAALACARHAVLSLAALTAPGDIEFSIVTSKGLVDDWSWTGSLPSSLFPTGSSSYCIALADGLSHFERAGFDHETVQRNEMGLIVIGETVDEMPDYCGTVLVLHDDGSCHVTNHLGERIDGTPIGVTTSLATEIASQISVATTPIVTTH